MSGYSLSWLRTEYVQLQKDRDAFSSCLNTLRARVRESEDDCPHRSPLLHEWAGTQACMGSLMMALHAVERTLEQVSDLIERIQSGEIQASDVEIPVPPGLNDRGKN